MITKIDKDQSNLIRESILNALKNVENNLGIEITLGHGRFGPDDITFNKIECKVRGSKSQEQKDLDWHLKVFSNEYENIDFDKVFSYQGKLFKVSGFNPRAKKMPFNIVDTLTDRKYKIDVRMLKEWFAKDKSTCE